MKRLTVFYIFIGVTVFALGVVVVLVFLLTQNTNTSSLSSGIHSPQQTNQNISATTISPSPASPQTPPNNPSSPAPFVPTATINNIAIPIEIADTPAKRTQGLSGVVSLPENNGMLFVFDESHIPAFWMYDMNFALDFIWIHNNTVVDITENVPPPAPNATKQQLPTYSPNAPVNMVLELNAGWVARNGGKDALLNQPIFIDIKQ